MDIDPRLGLYIAGIMTGGGFGFLAGMLYAAVARYGKGVS